MFKELTKLFEGLSFKKIKQWPKWAMFYFLGIITFFIIAAIGAALDPPIVGKQKELLRRWNMREVKGKGLLITFDDVNNIPWTIAIERDRKTDVVEKIMLMKNEKDFVFRYYGKGKIFGFETYGVYDSPLAIYGWFGSDRSGYVWHDLNFDSRIDEEHCLGSYNILVGDRWIRGLRSGDKGKQVETNEGVFLFDTKSGKWKKVSTKSNYEGDGIIL